MIQSAALGAKASKLCGFDVVSVRVEDIAPPGYAVDRATVRQKKTGHPVKFELTKQTRRALDDYMMAFDKQPGQNLFTGRRGPGTALTTRQYARLVSEWVASIGLDPLFWNTFAKANQGYGDLQGNWKPESRASPLGAYQN